MHPLHASLALAQYEQRVEQAQRHGRQRRLVAALRAQRRADRATAQARRLEPH